jgi:rhodanese-related sulfurtransferase/thioredoxin-related protein
LGGIGLNKGYRFNAWFTAAEHRETRRKVNRPLTPVCKRVPQGRSGLTVSAVIHMLALDTNEHVSAMRNSFLRLWLSVLVGLTILQAAEPVWLTDLDRAQTQAKAEKKSVLLFFHGSDWCPVCREMQREVIDSPEFIAYARQALVLVDVDFPDKGKQDEALKRANAALKARFNVGDNYPTLVLLNESGETLFQEAGYGGGGPAEVLPKLRRHAKPPGLSSQSGFKDLSVTEFAKQATDKQNVILDVRTPKEFVAGHIPGAVNLDYLASDFEKKARALDKTKTYLVLCATGVRSARACVKLSQLDFPKLYDLPGGFKAWVKAGEPVEK